MLADIPDTAALTQHGIVPADGLRCPLQPRMDGDQILFGFAAPESNAIYLPEL